MKIALVIMAAFAAALPLPLENGHGALTKGICAELAKGPPGSRCGPSREASNFLSPTGGFQSGPKTFNPQRFRPSGAQKDPQAQGAAQPQRPKQDAPARGPGDPVFGLNPGRAGGSFTDFGVNKIRKAQGLPSTPPPPRGNGKFFRLRR